jgi:ABC-type transport system involved in cytochrome bd biosynthesis fused ATPase/permease subunit
VQVTVLAVVAAILLPIPWWITVSVLVLYWVLTSAGLLAAAQRGRRLGRIAAPPPEQLARQWSRLAWPYSAGAVLVSVIALVMFPLRVALVFCVFMACAVFNVWRIVRRARRRLARAQPHVHDPG